MTNSIETTQKITNKQRLLGPDKEYIYCEIDGLPAAFTKCSLHAAIRRAAKAPSMASSKTSQKTVWQKVKAFFLFKVIKTHG